MHQSQHTHQTKQEVRALAPDVLCLQEVDCWEAARASLAELG